MRKGFTGQKCPRCGGNMYLDIDYLLEGSLISWFEQESCLQCGYIKYEIEGSKAKMAITRVTEKRELMLV